MQNSKDAILTIRFTGPRFEDHGVDLRDLGALMAARQILVKYVEDLWREENGKNPPSGFADALNFKIYTINPGSAMISVFDETPERRAEEQRHLFERQRSMRQRNREAARRMASEFQQISTGKKPRILKEALPYFKRFSTELNSEDGYELYGPPPEHIYERNSASTPSELLQQPSVWSDSYDPAFTPWSYAARTSSQTSQPASSVASPVVVDRSARERLAEYIADQKPPKAPVQEPADDEDYVVLIEGDLSKAIISTEQGDAVSVEFSQGLEGQRAHFVGRGVRDPKTKKLVRIVSIESIKLTTQLPLPLWRDNASLSSPSESGRAVDPGVAQGEQVPKHVDAESVVSDSKQVSIDERLAVALRDLELGREIEAIDLLVEHFDDLFLAGEFGAARHALSKLDPQILVPKVLTGVLMVTAHARNELGEARTEFLGRVQAALKEKWNLSPEEIDSVLRRLA